MIDSILDIIDHIKYDILKIQIPHFEYPPLHLNLKAYVEEDGGVWVESPDLPNFIASAENKEKIVDEIFESLLVYFDVPRYIAKKMDNQGEVILPNGEKIVVLPKSNLKLNYR